MLRMEKHSGKRLARNYLARYYVTLHNALEREVTRDPSLIPVADLRDACASMEFRIVGVPNGEDKLANAFEMATGGSLGYGLGPAKGL